MLGWEKSNDRPQRRNVELHVLTRRRKRKELRLQTLVMMLVVLWGEKRGDWSSGLERSKFWVSLRPIPMPLSMF